ncbi:MAG: BF3164 family lipoprotein [Bacteroidales bacterium]
MKKIIIFILICISTQCDNKHEYKKFKNFSRTISLNSKSYENQIKISNIVGIIDSIIVVKTGLDEYQYKLLNKNNFSFITQTGKKGKGPKELIGTINGNLDTINNYMYCASRSKLKIFRFDIDSLLKSNNYLPAIHTEIPEEFSHVSKINVINDSVVLGAGLTAYNIHIIDKEKNTLEKFARLPEKPKNIKSIHHSNLYNNIMSYNPKNKLIAMGYIKFDTLSGYDIKGKEIFQTVGPDFIQSDYKTQYKIKSKNAFKSIRTDNKNIYALYSGKHKIEKLSDANNLTDAKVIQPNTIHVFDWQGNPKLKIKLDKSINDFVIDKETNRLIGISSDDQSFVVYDFSKIRKALEHL